MCILQERNTARDNKAQLSAQLVKKTKFSKAHTERHHLRERKVSQAKNVTPFDHQKSLAWPQLLVPQSLTYIKLVFCF